MNAINVFLNFIIFNTVFLPALLFISLSLYYVLGYLNKMINIYLYKIPLEKFSGQVSDKLFTSNQIASGQSQMHDNKIYSQLLHELIDCC